MKEYVPKSESSEEIKKKRQSNLEAKLSIPDDYDEEYLVLLMDERYFRVGHPLFQLHAEDKANQLSVRRQSIKFAVPPEVLKALEDEEKVDSKVEQEMKQVRAIRKAHEMEVIMTRIHKIYEEFDEDLDELNQERLTIVYETTYANMSMLTMYQELLILRKFEDKENELSLKLAEKIQEKEALQEQVLKFFFFNSAFESLRFFILF